MIIFHMTSQKMAATKDEKDPLISKLFCFLLET